MTFDPTHFESLSPMHLSPKIHTADGYVITASHIRSIKNTISLSVPEVLYVP